MILIDAFNECLRAFKPDEMASLDKAVQGLSPFKLPSELDSHKMLLYCA
jgi:hypothetical protein